MRFVVLAALMCAAATSVAGPTALTVMPISDMLRQREALYVYSIAGFEQNADKGYVHAHSMEVGLLNICEAGFDNDFLGNTVWNLKLNVLSKSTFGLDGLAVGTQNYVDGKGDLFVVGMHDFKRLRLHMGVLSNSCSRLMAGIDAPFGKATAMAEWTSGDGARGWLSVAVPIEHVAGMNLQFAIGIPARRSDGYQHLAMLSYGWRM